MLIVSVNKILMASILRLPCHAVAHTEQADANRQSMKQRMVIAVFFIAKIIEKTDISISAINIITFDAMNKYGYAKLSQSKIHSDSMMNMDILD